MAVVFAAELDRLLGRLRQRHAGTTALTRHTFVGHLEVFGTPPKTLGRNFLQLPDGIRRGRMRRPRRGVDCLASAGHARPRQMPGRVAPDQLALVPRHTKQFSRDPVRIGHRLGPEITDARMDVQAPVGLHDDQAVESGGASHKRAHRNADTADLRAMSGSILAIVPLEKIRPTVERLLDEGAGRVGPLPSCVGLPELRPAFGGVQPSNLHLIDVEPARRFGEQRLHHGDALHAARLRLCAAGRSVGQHGDAAETHGCRLVQQRDDATRLRGITARLIRPVLADGEHVEREDLPFLREAGLETAVQAGARAADRLLLLAVDSHHDRRVGLLGEKRRDDRGDRASALAAESPTRVGANEHDVGRFHVQPARNRCDGLNRALGRAEQVQLAVLPVGHRGTRLERLVAGVRRHEGLVQHQRRVLESSFDVTEGPLVGNLARREAPLPGRREVLLGPLDLLELGARRGRPGLGRRAHPDVPFPRVGPIRSERIEGIDVERQRLPVDVDPLDGFRGGQLVHRGNGKHRLTLIHRFGRERSLALQVGFDCLTQVGDDVGRAWDLFGGQDCLDARHGERRAGVEAPDARVRHRAEQEPGEQHPFGVIILGELRLASHLGDEVGCRVVAPDQFAFNHSEASCARSVE